ncbi:MAG: YaaA family protein [Tannerellaceae bacterium]|jgi:cytoplasmic iron level regulating protein YaaA (DUF328/UPF0246 family)|nr:YaaA family protein [Tannerellaceae bacterium]
MIIIISPSKSINFKTPGTRGDATVPRFEQDAAQLMSLLSVFRADEIAEKEKVSIQMALATYEYIQTFPMQAAIRKEAVYAYSGNVYDKLNVEGLNEEALQFLQGHVCIFSALYGILRPLDRIKAYRLDMGTRLVPDLYTYWKEKVTQTLIDMLEENDYLLVNLASAEYFRMIDLKSLPRQTRILTPVFQQEKNGKLTTNSLFAKQARGLMLRFIAENKLTDPSCMQAFDAAGYFFNPLLSSPDEWYFTR